MEQILKKLAKKYGYPLRKLTTQEYLTILTKAHHILYGTKY